MNKAKILHYEIWDGETGEADVIAELTGSKKLKAFTLDHFEANFVYEVNLSLFCKEFTVNTQPLTPDIINTDDKYQVELKGVITGVSSDDEEGEIVIVNTGDIFVNVYITFNDTAAEQPKTGLFFTGTGRLDIELE